MREWVEKAAKEFNERHSPEAIVEVLGVEGEQVRVRVRGTACKACGFDENVVDFAYILQDVLGRRVEIKGLEEEEEGFLTVLSMRG